VRAAIAARSCGQEGRRIGVTASIGVAEFREEMASMDALLSSADAAMYEAKSQGRNRVVFRAG